MLTITSRSNSLIKDIANLHDAKHRAEEQLFIAEGLRTCSTLLSTGITCTHILYTHAASEHIQTLSHEAAAILVSDDVMKKISTMSSPSGILGVFNIPQQQDKPITTPGLVLLDISDPGNMGTLIRTAAAVNAQTVVVIEGCDPWSPKVVQASAGTIGMVAIKKWSWDKLIENKNEHQLYALVVKDGTSIQEISLDKGLLVIGNEARGIPDDLLADCERKVTLSMPGGTESLNAAVAGSIALYMGCVKI